MGVDLSTWNGQQYIHVAADNYVTMIRQRGGTYTTIYTNAFWGGGNNYHVTSSYDIKPGDILYFRCQDAGGSAAMFFNYINTDGLQVGVGDEQGMNSKGYWSLQRGNYRYQTIPTGAWTNVPNSLVGDYSGWFVQRSYIRNFPSWQVATYNYIADYRAYGNPTWFRFIVPPYDEWTGHVGEPIGILRKGSTGNMSIGDTSGIRANRINEFKDIKKSTESNSHTIMSEMRDWLRTYSANIGGFDTGNRFSFGEFADSIIWGVRIAVENESGRYANTNDGKISVEGVRGSGDWGGIFKFTLQGNGVFKSATTAGRHTFTNLGGTARSSVNYVYRLTIQDVSAGENVGFDVDVTVGHNTAGSKVTSVTSSANSFNKTNGQADVMTFSGQNVSGMSSFLTVLCKPRDV